MKIIYQNIAKRALLLSLMVLLSLMGYSVTYYVSNSGSDTNNGTSASTPWKTLSKVNAATFAPGDQILFQRGSSFYGTLTPNYSGTSGNPITYGAYGTGANPVITGFTTITSGWTNEGGGIYSKIITSEAQTNMVTIDGVQYGMGRYPNSTFLTYESASSNVSITDNQLGTSTIWTGAEALIVKNGYRIERCKISNHSANTLNYTIFSGLNTSANSTGNYFIQNDIRTLDQYGEWYHDYSGTGKFYMFFGAVDPSSKIIMVATLNNLIKVTTAKTNIAINDLTLTGSINVGFIAQYNCHNLTIQNSSFSFIGSDGIFIDGQYATINNSSFNYCNRISIMTKGANATVSDNSVNNNAVILGQGNYGYSGTNAIMVMNDNAIVTGNSIQNTATNGIFIDGTVAIGLIKNNYIYNTCIHNWDHGAIYTTKFHTSLVIDGNIVERSGGSGIYLDAVGGYSIAKNNSVTGCASSGIHVHSQSYGEIFNNTVYDCKYGVFIQNTSGSNDSHDVSMYNNVFVAKTVSQVALMYYSDYAAYASSFPTYSFYNNVYARPINDVNTFYYTGGNKTFAQWKSFTGQDATSRQSPFTISNENDLRFEYNATKAPIEIALSFPMIDVTGVKYSNSVTLQPFTSVVLLKDPNPATVPGAPLSVAAVAGNATATVTFSAPLTNGGSEITGYTVTSNPAGGVDANVGSTSLSRTITGLTNGTNYTFTVKATNAMGSSVASAPSNSITPKAPVATAFTLSGPTSGNVNSPSANFSVTPNNPYTGTITITPSGTASTGLTPKVLTFSNSSATQTFSYTPVVAGNITLSVSNSSGLTNPANLSYTANAVVPGAPTSVTATADISSAIVSFTAPINTGGSAITGYTVTSSPAGGVDLHAGSVSLNHTITGLTPGVSYTFTVKASNSAGSSVASAQSNSVVPIENLPTKQAEIVPSHFIPVWQGENGLNHMNIMVVSAILEDLPLQANDEIAVFSGSKCVGASKLAKAINTSDNTSFLTISASQNDGTNNGFTDNDTIVFKLWDNVNQREMAVISAVYRNDISGWMTNGKFSPGTTSVVELVSYVQYKQTINLVKGYNLMSTYLVAQNPDAKVVTQSLKASGSLVKLQDETGNSLENWGTFGGWINNVGNIQKTEGYKIKVVDNCSLEVTGRPIALPLDIPLKNGWNIISFPRTDIIDAMQIIQPLITQNKLVKVQDELGNSIENWGIYGGWKNGIGNFVPGKAYKVKMSSDATLTIQENYTKSAVIMAQVEKTVHFTTGFESNGTDHMNINVVGLQQSGFSAGDEIAAFDGKICVGTIKLSESHLASGSVSLVAPFASTESQIIDGFKEGNSIQLVSWNKENNTEKVLATDIIEGKAIYVKNSSVLLALKSVATSSSLASLSPENLQIKVFPNPSQGRVTVQFNEVPVAGSKIEITDVSGRKIVSRIISTTSEEFNLSNQAPGLYFVKTIINSKEDIKKLIVN